MAFYHQLITEKSWQSLQQLKKKYKFILIGGWAVFLYTKTLKSKDIDLICEYQELKKFKEDFDLTKNPRLKKYEIKLDNTDIDIYLPFYSHLGLPVEQVKHHIKTIQGFTVPQPEILLIFKQFAYSSRKGSIKGEKDRIDIISLLQLPLNLKLYLKTLKQFKKNILLEELKNLLKNTYQVPELNLNRHQFAKFKRSFLEKFKD